MFTQVGSSRVVLLDEPTSGLDHKSRRAVWDIIERQKKVCFVGFLLYMRISVPFFIVRFAQC